MSDVQVKPDLEAMATSAAALTAGVLNQAIAKNGQANWLLSGGTAPMGAYRLLASTYRNQVDWTKVVVAIGDERCVSFDSPDASWPVIDRVFLRVVGLPAKNQLRPKSNLSPEEAAADYGQMLNSLIPKDDRVPRFDLVWLGMGEDGHTMSLFPGHIALSNIDSLVVAVHDSPKPPPDRISLTLSALTSASNCLVMASGSGKSDAVARAFDDDKTLTIYQATSAIEVAGGQVTWLLDEAAARLMKE